MHMAQSAYFFPERTSWREAVNNNRAPAISKSSAAANADKPTIGKPNY
jgi:hypothetical protein